MDLQALRYAAMVSAMTFDDLVGIFQRHLDSGKKDNSVDARSQLAAWLDAVGGEASLSATMSALFVG